MSEMTPEEMLDAGTDMIQQALAADADLLGTWASCVGAIVEGVVERETDPAEAGTLVMVQMMRDMFGLHVSLEEM